MERLYRARQAAYAVAMLDTILMLLIAVLIVMPVVAILLMALERVTSSEWPPRALAIASLVITLVLIGAYLFLT